MFKNSGINEILENVIRLTRTHFIGPLNRQNLKMAYQSFLKRAQPNVPQPKDINLSFKWKREDVALLLEIFKEESILDDFDEVFDTSSCLQTDKTINRVQLALKKIEEIQPSFAALIDLVIHTIFASPSKHQGDLTKFI